MQKRSENIAMVSIIVAIVCVAISSFLVNRLPCDVGISSSIGSLIIGATAFGLMKLFSIGFSARMKFKEVPCWRWSMYFIVLWLCSSLLSYMLVKYVPGASAEQKQSNSVAAIIMVLVIAPVSEELMFRGFVYGSMRAARYKVIAAAAASSGLFALLHGTISQLVPTFLAGMLFCLIYEATGVVWYSVAGHSFYNLLALLSPYIALPSWMGSVWMAPVYIAVIVGLLYLFMGRYVTRRIRFDRAKAKIAEWRGLK